MLKPALLILSLTTALSAFAAGPPMKISDYPHTNSVSSNKLFIVAAPGTPGTNWNISFGELNAQIKDPTNIPAPVWTNNGNYTWRVSEPAPSVALPGPSILVRKDGSIFTGTNVNLNHNLADYTTVYNPSVFTLTDSNQPAINFDWTAANNVNFDTYSTIGGSVVSDKDVGYSILSFDTLLTNGVEHTVSIVSDPSGGVGGSGVKIQTNGTITFFAKAGGNIIINKKEYVFPATNLTSGQVFASDGGTPQQIYGIDMPWVLNTSTGAYTNANQVGGNNIAVKGEAIQFSSGSSTITESSGHLQLSSGGSQAITAAAGSFYSGSGAGLTGLVVDETELSFTDITTADVSTTKHGLTPKAPNDTTKFLRGDGSWAAPPVTNNSSIRATDASSVSTSFASTGLSVTLAAGATYTFDCYLYVTDTVSADGVKIDFNGGSATANVFVAQINAYDTAPNLFLSVSSLATAASASSFNGIGAFEVHGTIKVNAGGTFIPRFAQVAHTSGTLILLSGSSIRLFQ